MTRIDGALTALRQAHDQLSAAPEAARGRLAESTPTDSRPVLAAARRSLRTLVASQTALRKELDRGTVAVLGEGRRKQVDVFLADWDRGLELAVSTKTLALGVSSESELRKNLPNRWEEFDGDLKNLRGRFPLAAIGALLLVPASALRTNAFLAAVDMKSKLTAPGRPWVNAYDAATVIVASNWSQDQAADVHILGGDELPAGFPDELRVERFYDDLLKKVLERSPSTEHAVAPQRRAEAHGERGSAYLEAAEIANETDVGPASESGGEAF
jgi:hypothetical protein